MTVCVAAAYFLIGWRHTWCWCSCHWGVGGGISWLLDCQEFVDEINTGLCVRVLALCGVGACVGCVGALLGVWGIIVLVLLAWLWCWCFLVLVFMVVWGVV